MAFWAYLGEKDVLHSLEACCTPWMGNGQRCLSIQTVGNPHRWGATLDVKQILVFQGRSKKPIAFHKTLITLMMLAGKFTPGITEPDPKTWKANFRCAMNSLPDIEEVKDKSINKGCEAVRVYRMLQVVKNKKSSKSQDSRRRKKVRG